VLHFSRGSVAQRFRICSMFNGESAATEEVMHLQVQIAVKGRCHLFVELTGSGTVITAVVEVDKDGVRCIECRNIIDVFMLQIANKAFIGYPWQGFSGAGNCLIACVLGSRRESR